DAGNVTPIPRGLQRGGRAARRAPDKRTAFLLVGLGRFDRLGPDIIELAAENLARFTEARPYRSIATVAWGAHAGLDAADSFAAQLRGFLRVRAAGATRLTRVDLHVLTRAEATRVHSALSDFAHSRPPGTLRIAPLAPARTRTRTGSRKVPGTTHLIVASDARRAGRETWRGSLLTGGTSAAIFSQTQEFATSALEKLDREFQSESLTNERVKTLGAKLAALTLHPALADALLASRATTLSVVHDAAASRIPWEALNVHGWFPALESGLSRRYATADLVPARFDTARRAQRELGVLLIANPTLDLPGAAEERARIATLLGKSRSARLVEIVGRDATVARITAELESGRFDVLHFAGHAFFDEGQPGESGLVLADGELSGATLSALRRLPPLVVFNACESARLRGHGTRRGKGPGIAKARSQGMQRNLGLAESLLRAGLAHYIGTHWPVVDASAATFAGVFYQSLLRTSIGGALVQARRAVRARRSPDWADYVHYGDSEFRLKVI
ncbi:MAG: CHAT domain-containing protein, partial [Steroidobacteraceae bacterium]|nr:CHAT domain-containing protein [Steroidobacteraceae bacterium]